MSSSSIAYPVGVFAHNDADKIIACLDSLQAASARLSLSIQVLINGSTDETLERVKHYARTHPGVHPVLIALGDKSNAWNVFVHEVAREAETHFFVDGDVEVQPDSLEELLRQLEAHPEAYAASGVPEDCGWSARHQRELMLKQGGIAGNLYALSGTFLRLIRDRKVYLPVGHIGEDSLLGSLAYRDLDPRQEWDMRRIVVCERARFRYEPLAWWRPRDLRLEWRRMIRYGVRHCQSQMLKRHLTAQGLSAMPRTAAELYPVYAHLLTPRNGFRKFFDRIAIRDIQRQGRHLSHAG